MSVGKLQRGNEAVPVEYELPSDLNEKSGVLKLMQTPLAGLSTTILDMAGANHR